MSWSADIADAIIALDNAVKAFEAVHPDIARMPAFAHLVARITDMQETSLGEGQHFDSLEEARQFRAPRCWGTNSRVPNYMTKAVEYYKPTCGNIAPHDPHVI